MTMAKQRRSFFVDDILHMVMPENKNTNYSNNLNDRKRKRSLISGDDKHKEEDDNSTGEDLTNKKFRFYNDNKDKDHDQNEEEQEDDDDDNDESKHSQIIDVLGDGGTGEESSMTDNSSNLDNNSGKLK